MSMPREVEKVKPKKVDVIFSIRIARPVKPLDNRFMGCINILMIAACINPDTRTQNRVNILRISRFSFIVFHIVNL